MAGNSLFYSYSHRDDKLRGELEKHLSLLRREGKLKDWHFRNIEAGAEWENEINKNLESANIILLLISPDFMFSEYCYCVEMNHAIAMHNSGKARVIPVIIRAVDWKNAPFGKLQVLPTNGKAVTSWDNIDEAFLNITTGIRKVCDTLSQPSARIEAKGKVINKESSGENKGVSTSNSTTQGYYCSKCGIKAGGPPSECVGWLGGAHDFKQYTGYVYCSRCGVTPGRKNSCTGSSAYHSFKVYAKPVYCSKCGVKADTKSECNSIFDVSHDFCVYSNKLHCVKCGTRPGNKTVCTGMTTSHDFRQLSGNSNSKELPTLW